MKKSVSIILCILMTVSVLPVSVFAEEFQEEYFEYAEPEYSYEEPVWEEAYEAVPEEEYAWEESEFECYDEPETEYTDFEELYTEEFTEWEVLPDEEGAEDLPEKEIEDEFPEEAAVYCGIEIPERLSASELAELSFRYAPDAAFGEPVQILKQPESFTGEEGDCAALSLIATGTDLSYSWYCSRDGGETYDLLTTVYGDSGVAVQLSADNSGCRFVCMVMDSYSLVFSDSVTICLSTDAESPVAEAATDEDGETVDSLDGEIFNYEYYSVANDYQVQIKGVYHQSEARTMLSGINEFRTGEDAWAWNYSNTEQIYYNNLCELSYSYELEQDAMQRAAETAVYYSHTRPNGSSCFAAYTGSYSSMGENIATGYNMFRTAEDVLEAWREDAENYSGQGHRRNMLSKSFNCVGVACFEATDTPYSGSLYYWVQEFGYTNDGTCGTAANDTLTVVDVYLNNDLIDSVVLTPALNNLTVREGECCVIPAVTVQPVMVNSTWRYTPYIYGFPVSTQTADSNVAILTDNNTKVLGVSKGTTTLDFAAQDSTASVAVTVQGADDLIYPESQHPYANKSNDTQYFTIPNATSLTAEFTAESQTEKNYDKLYVYDGTDTLIATFTGSFGGQTVTVPGDTMKLVLKSDASVNAYGYAFTSITAEMPVTQVDPINTTVELTGHPADSSHTIGEEAVFSVEAEGENLSYQWYVSTDNGATWESLGGSNNTENLKITVMETMDGNLYRCEVSNESGTTVTTDAARLTVIPEIIRQPIDMSCILGDSVKFNVGATGANLSYQWEYSKDSGKSWRNATLTGNKTDTISMKVIESRSNYQFRCVVTDGNDFTVVSEAATLRIDIVIQVQPESRSSVLGKSVKFNVEASGVELSYQWQFSTDNGVTWKNTTVNGCKTAELSVWATEARSNQLFRCILKDKNGLTAISENARLTIVKITENPISQTHGYGEKVIFAVQATGMNLCYQWQFSTDNGETWKNTTVTGCKTSELTVWATAKRDNQQFRCVITDENGNKLTSAAATLTVR